MICANPDCLRVFEPARSTQRFHSAVCRMAFWHRHHQRNLHRCPLCGLIHNGPEGIDCLHLLTEDLYARQLLERRDGAFPERTRTVLVGRNCLGCGAMLPAAAGRYR